MLAVHYILSAAWFNQMQCPEAFIKIRKEKNAITVNLKL